MDTNSRPVAGKLCTQSTVIGVTIRVSCQLPATHCGMCQHVLSTHPRQEIRWAP